jgi:hypothetical protein
MELINYSPVIRQGDIVSVSCEVDDRSDLNRQSDLSEKKKIAEMREILSHLQDTTSNEGIYGV